MGKNHVTPTAEELEAQALANAEKAEKLVAEEAEKKKKEAGEIPEVPEIPETPPKTPETPPETPETPPVVPETPETPPIKPEEPDYKEKFKQSSKEAIILAAKAEQTEIQNKAIAEAAEIKDIPDDVLKTEFPQWDEMTQTEQQLAKQNYINNKRFELIHQASLKGKDIEEWNGKVHTFITNPQTLIDNPELEGKQDDFQVFASKPTRRGVDFETLVSAYLHDATKMAVKHKGEMFPTGNGGVKEKEKPKSNKISLQQARVLREQDYPKYVEYLQKGLIDNTIANPA